MKPLPKTFHIESKGCSYTYTLDEYNYRIRLDDYYGNMELIIRELIDLSIEHKIEKCIIKSRHQDFELLLTNGFVFEAKVDRYFLGSDMYFFCKYFTSERRKSDIWAEEDQLLNSVQSLQKKSIITPANYDLKICETAEDAKALASLYRRVFNIYPVPLDDADYIRKSISGGNVFLAYYHQGQIVSAVSADVNTKYRNAEVTDCATLPDFRQYGLMQHLLHSLEDVLYEKFIFCLYTIARATSFGMNAAFQRLNYSYRGRLANNCNIYEGIEDMNVWVKNISAKK